MSLMSSATGSVSIQKGNGRQRSAAVGVPDEMVLRGAMTTGQLPSWLLSSRDFARLGTEGRDRFCRPMNGHAPLSPAARALGYAGVFPQVACIALILAEHEWRYAALAGGFAYAAAIFSFLGGVWWGQALQSGRASTGAYLVAVLPSLFAVALFLPWSFGWEWPGPALLYLGVLILGTPMIDRALGYAGDQFLRLRRHLSIGLGSMTIVLGLLADRVV